MVDLSFWNVQCKISEVGTVQTFQLKMPATTLTLLRTCFHFVEYSVIQCVCHANGNVSLETYEVRVISKRTDAEKVQNFRILEKFLVIMVQRKIVKSLI